MSGTVSTELIWFVVDYYWKEITRANVSDRMTPPIPNLGYGISQAWNTLRCTILERYWNSHIHTQIYVHTASSDTWKLNDANFHLIRVLRRKFPADVLQEGRPIRHQVNDKVNQRVGDHTQKSVNAILQF